MIRPIRPEDRDELAFAHAHLSAETVRRRFLSPKPRLTDRELSYLTEIDGVDHVAFVAVEDGRIVGVARWVRLPGDPQAAEAAVVVADERQGQGVGRRLGDALVRAAGERGVTRFTATLLSDNIPAHRFFASLARRLDSRHSGGVEELVAELDTAA